MKESDVQKAANLIEQKAELVRGDEILHKAISNPLIGHTEIVIRVGMNDEGVVLKGTDIAVAMRTTIKGLLKLVCASLKELGIAEG